MSMILELHTVSDASLARVLADPPLVWKVVSPDDDTLYDAARAEAGGGEGGFFQRLFGRPARGMTAAEVKAVAGALSGIDEAFMRARFDPAQMTQLDIYPGIWDRDPAEDDSLGYCLEYFSELKAFVTRAAERGAGLVITLT